MISPLTGSLATTHSHPTNPSTDTLLSVFGDKMSNGVERSPSPAVNTNQPSASVGSHSPEENEAHNSTDDSSNTNNSGMEQLLFQRLASNFAPGFPLRSPFQFNNLAPFLASLQQGRGQRTDDSNQQRNLEQQMLGALAAAASSSSHLNSDLRADSANSADDHSVEPEDLSLREKLRGEQDDNGGDISSSWSFEEQFKQLYDLSDDINRKQWLDDWFKFMQDNGKPVTRIPIMAKQVLDLYELYRLVVQHGGLVEIINKKLWREITKGLNLPSSITSAAFTLRTQYTKYLYDYECAREKLSHPADLQSAIESNKREGRRNPPASNGSTPLHHSNGGFSYPMVPNSAAAAMSSLFARHMNPFVAMRPSEDHLVAANRQLMPTAGFGDQLGDMDAQQREMIQRVADALNQQNQHANSGRASASSVDSATSAKRMRHSSPTPAEDTIEKRTSVGQTRSSLNGLDQLLKTSASTHLKITSNSDKSMIVSMEVNGTVFQGMLFAVNSINNDMMMNDGLTDLFGNNEH
ncbi:hypothetical protein M3Y97_00411300 [Aphelenchoides bicaudatus]|nr:hypothetical protein M3Y97_00411300 [Aphelenchoides bicaudatus]